MTDVLIRPASGTIAFTNQNSKALVMSGSGGVEASLEISGSTNGQLLSVTDSAAGTLFAVTDPVSQLPLLEVIDDQRVLFYGPMVGKTYADWLTFGDWSTTATTKFLAFEELNENTSGAVVYYNFRIAPCDGKLVKALLFSNVSTPGNTVMSPYLNQVASAEYTSAAVNINGTNTVWEFDLGNTPFQKKDRVYIEVNPTGNLDDVQAVIIVVLNWRTL